MPDPDPRKWYGNSRWWRRRAKLQMELEPLCRYCLQRRGIPVLASCADHIVPVAGSYERFRTGALQSLCTECHNRVKQNEESDARRGYSLDVDPTTGYPIDENHPGNKGPVG